MSKICQNSFFLLSSKVYYNLEDRNVKFENTKRPWCAFQRIV